MPILLAVLVFLAADLFYNPSECPEQQDYEESIYGVVIVALLAMLFL
jgi:hypothetical protein